MTRDQLAKSIFAERQKRDGYEQDDIDLMWAGCAAFPEEVASCYEEADAQLARLALAKAGISATG